MKRAPKPCSGLRGPRHPAGVVAFSAFAMATVGTVSAADPRVWNKGLETWRSEAQSAAPNRGNSLLPGEHWAVPRLAQIATPAQPSAWGPLVAAEPSAEPPVSPAPVESAGTPAPAPPVDTAPPKSELREPPLPASESGDTVNPAEQPQLFDPLAPRPLPEGDAVRARVDVLKPKPANAEAAVLPETPPASDAMRGLQGMTFLDTPDTGDFSRLVDPNARFYGAAVPPVVPEISPRFPGNEEIALQSERGWLAKGRLLLRLTAGTVFDDNVSLRERHRKSDFILTLSPGVTYLLGSDEGHFSLLINYTVSALYFVNRTSKDSLDQAGSIGWRYRFTRLTVGGNFEFRSVNGSNRDAGDRVQRRLFYLGAFANYLLTEKISLDFNGDLTFSQFKGLLDSDEARLQAFINFSVRPKLQLGTGFLFGMLAVDRGPTQMYEQALGRAVYTPTAKLAFNASAGFEVRQLGRGVSTRIAPVVSLGVGYSPWRDTTLTFDVRHRTYPSTALVGQDYQATGLVASLRRTNILDRFSTSLTFGYEHSRYEQTLRGVMASRRDDFFYSQVAVSWSVRRYASLNAFYEFSFNDSRGAGSRSFERSRVGILAVLSF